MSNGDKLRMVVGPGSTPDPGGAVVFRAETGLAAYPSFLFLGDSSTSLGGVPLPIDLTVVGWAGCYQYARMDVLVPLPIVRGAARLNLTLPNAPTLIGVPFYTQAYKPSPTGTVKTSNGLRGAIHN